MAGEQTSAAPNPAPAKEKPEPSARKKIRLARLEKIKKSHEAPRVRVTPRDDDMRRLLRHPGAGRFRSSGSLEWPNDSFTKRRIKDGSVTLEAPREGEAAKPATQTATTTQAASTTQAAKPAASSQT